VERRRLHIYFYHVQSEQQNYGWQHWHQRPILGLRESGGSPHLFRASASHIGTAWWACHDNNNNDNNNNNNNNNNNKKIFRQCVLARLKQIVITLYTLNDCETVHTSIRWWFIPHRPDGRYLPTMSAPQQVTFQWAVAVRNAASYRPITRAGFKIARCIGYNTTLIGSKAT